MVNHDLVPSNLTSIDVSSKESALLQLSIAAGLFYHFPSFRDANRIVLALRNLQLEFSNLPGGRVVLETLSTASYSRLHLA